MKTYTVNIGGENFQLFGLGDSEFMGIDATRVIEAHSEEDAKAEALRSVETDPMIYGALIAGGERKPRIFVKDISETSAAILGGEEIEFFLMEGP